MSIVELRVRMDCPGCESKIRRDLRKLDGVDNVDVDMGMQKVTVTGYADRKKVLKTVRKNGRRAELWPFPYNPEYHDFNSVYYNQYYSRKPATYFTSNPETSFTNIYENRFYSSYNYEVHGYNGHDHGYYQDPPFSTVIDDRAIEMFSDENAHSCTIM